ncbi:hypothetical protein [Streptomyces sp. NPDC059874]|uniref:hypothetical protein n=1 Tax=Streptomyces sp. NPDC059874 TaxID=3346983 RepID=UPI003657DCDB
MRSRTLNGAAVALASATAVLLIGTPSSAADGVAWTAGHGTAEAWGTRWTERGTDGFLSVKLVLKGELKNTGKDCYSVWSQFTYDFAPGPARKHATQCGPGTTPVDFSSTYLPTTTGSVFICKGETLKDCGERRSITHWPVQRPSGAPAE